jgi:hypothetical protein
VTNAGWYPDPAGAPDTYRYWDGQAWSQMTTTQPSAPAAPAPPPQQPQQPQQPATSYAPQPPQYQPAWSPTPPPGGKGGGSRTVLVVVAAIVVLAILGVGGFFGIRALTGDDSPKGGDDAAGGPSDGPSQTIRATGIQCTGGKPAPTTDPGTAPTSISGGGLTIPLLDGYTVDPDVSRALTFADDIPVQYAQVEAKWVSEYAVGGLPRANGFDSTEQAAEVVMQCLTTNKDVYAGFSGRKDLTREKTTVDGKPAYRITSEIRVDNPDVTAEGDVTSVIVVDTGDAASYGVFLGVVPIGDSTRIAQEEQTIKAITVD